MALRSADHSRRGANGANGLNFRIDQSPGHRSNSSTSQLPLSPTRNPFLTCKTVFLPRRDTLVARSAARVWTARVKERLQVLRGPASILLSVTRHDLFSVIASLSRPSTSSGMSSWCSQNKTDGTSGSQPHHAIARGSLQFTSREQERGGSQITRHMRPFHHLESLPSEFQRFPIHPAPATTITSMTASPTLFNQLIFSFFLSLPFSPSPFIVSVPM